MVDSATGKTLWSVLGKSVAESAGIGAFAVDPSGAYIAAHFLVSSHEVWLIDAQTGGRVRRLDIVNAFLGCLAFSPDGMLLAGGDLQGYATVWETSRGNVRQRLRVSTARLTHLRFTSENHLVTLAYETPAMNVSRRLQLWELANGVKLDSFLDVPLKTNFLAIKPDDGVVLCGGEVATLWRFPLAPPLFRLVSKVNNPCRFLGDDFLLAALPGWRAYGVCELRDGKPPGVLWARPDTSGRCFAALNRRMDEAIVYNGAQGGYHRLSLTGSRERPLGVELASSDHLGSFWETISFWPLCRDGGLMASANCATASRPAFCGRGRIRPGVVSPL